MEGAKLPFFQLDNKYFEHRPNGYFPEKSLMLASIASILSCLDKLRLNTELFKDAPHTFGVNKWIIPVSKPFKRRPRMKNANRTK